MPRYRRSLTSYAKVQTVIGNLIRGRSFQLYRDRVMRGQYLDIGCGRNTHEALLNLDYLWHPEVDVCWDITKGLPFPDGSMKGIFSEHCLEHFPLRTAFGILKETRRILAPRGRIRIVVPDGELYLSTYNRQNSGETSPRFPYQDAEEQNEFWSPILSVNRIFYQDRESPFGHHTIYDFALLKLLLLKCGFDHVQRCQFAEGADTRLLVDSVDRQVESLYVEASVA